MKNKPPILYDFVEALNILKNGGKIRDIYWTDREFYYKKRSDGMLTDQFGTIILLYHINITEKKWIEYKPLEKKVKDG